MNHSIKYIDFKSTNQFSELFLDYVSENKKLKDFYSYSPIFLDNTELFKEIDNFKFDREILVKVLQKQNSSDSLQQQNVELLKKTNTYTVCTGHQLCLFTGPLYFIYKIITTINLAEKLKEKFPDKNFVPVYWMATEDHDFVEINHAYINNKKVEWVGEGESKKAVGRISAKDIYNVISDIKTLLGNSENAKKIIEIFVHAYSKGNLADATRALVDSLFSKYGLIIIDADNKEFKKIFSETIKDDLLNNTAFKKVSETNAQLMKLDYKPQVNPREINLFYLDKDGFRNRLIFENNKFQLVDSEKKWSKEELLKEIDDNPERFSPNVILRPLYQQSVLPNLAYVGGPSEIDYWLEVKSTFEHYKIFFPALVPRNFMVWMDEKSVGYLKKSNLKEEQLFISRENLLNNIISELSSATFDLKKYSDELERVYSSVKKSAENIDSTLYKTADAEKQKAINGLNKINSKIIRAEKMKNDVLIKRLDYLYEMIFPNGTLQERRENFSSFYSLYGEDWIDFLKNNFNPFQLKLMIAQPK